MISSLCKTTYTLRSPQQRSSPIPWSWYFPGAGLRLQSEAPWSGPLVQCQSHPWLSGEVKGEKNSMLNQDHSGGLLTPAVPSSCSLITPVVVSLVNKNRRRSLKKKKGKKKTREECYWETVSHMNTGMRFTDKHNTTDSQADRKSLTVPLSPGSRSCRWCRPLCRSQTDWGNCSNPGLWFPGYSSAPRWLLLSTVEQKLSL